ncbi:MAG TPA: TetR/AcrR family transcriptional regulator [Edaphobacter sp.]|nr:TetR/AcrR family transcriptional regulator [Edaphobacter sp.]
MPRAVPNPKPTRKPDRKQKIVADFRRSEILAAATKVFGNKGFEATRMEEIAKVARLAKGTLYLYFDSKDAIYQATVRQALTELANLTEEQVRKEPSLAGKIAAFIRVRVAFWDEQQSFYRVILSLSREGQYRKRSIAWQRETVLYLQEIFAEGAKASEIPEQDFLGAAWAMMDTIRGTSERRIYTEGRSTEDDTRFLTEFLLRALQIKAP